MTGRLVVQTTDYHTAGEPFRIVAGGPTPRGRTVLDKRSWYAEHADHIRQLLVNEPRGHADMYGCFVVEPDDAEGDLGVVFFHNAGYSTACGHGTIALVTWALESGLLPAVEGEQAVVVDVPSGRLHCRAALRGGRVEAISFVNVPSFVVASAVDVTVEGALLTVGISFGGAFYASVAAEAVGLQVRREDLTDMIRLGRAIKAEIEAQQDVVHPHEPRLRDIYGVIFHEPVPDPDGRLAQRNVTVFADGEVDRSPCGSGTSARLALLYDAGELALGSPFVHHGIAGETFLGKVVATGQLGASETVTTEITGRAFLTGNHTFVLDERDTLGTGFQLR